jgi:hypothetical protein
MANITREAVSPRMSDAAVNAKTGRDWKEWFAILDKAGAKKMNHREIAKYLSTNHGVGPWWQQMVTVTYEQARGLREKYQTPGGYQISVSRTLNAPLAKLYKSFTNEKLRNAWLGEDGLVVRKANANKSMRVNWNDGQTSLEIGFCAKGDDKAQVAVQHSKLPNAKASEKMKIFWTKALDRLRASLET